MNFNIIFPDDFKDTFNNYCASMFGSKLRTLRSTESLGLIKARLLGARAAQGAVFVMLDAHMEVQEKWSVSYFNHCTTYDERRHQYDPT
jgi:hypothetical protein